MLAYVLQVVVNHKIPVLSINRLFFSAHTFFIKGCAVAGLALLFIPLKLSPALVYPLQSTQKSTTFKLPIATNNIVSIRSTKEATKVSSFDEQKMVTQWLAKRYRISTKALTVFIEAAYQVARTYKLDPLLILSVIAIESRFNPLAESPAGAQGLMQIMSHIHHEKLAHFGGQEAALNPIANITVGTQILKEYIKRTGSLEAGLKTYVGAGLNETDGGYGSKVLSEYKRLQAIIKNKTIQT